VAIATGPGQAHIRKAAYWGVTETINERTPGFNTIEEAIADIRAGRMVVVCDSPDRENEGDLVMAAEHVTPEAINFMAAHGRGLVCMPVTGERLDQLGLGLMVTTPGDRHTTAFTVSVDAREGTTTGISAAERAHTVHTMIDPETRADDLLRPGHIFPLRAKPGGVLRRAGHTEAAVDLAALGGLYPAGVICEILNCDGTMARVPQLLAFARTHGLKIVTIEDLIRYRMVHDKLVSVVAETDFPSIYGHFRLRAYEDHLTGEVHLALFKGRSESFSQREVLVRVHSQCLTGDVLGSLRCDCGGQLTAALRRIEQAGEGVFLYMRQEGRGIGLGPKIRAYALQDHGLDTVQANEHLGYPADARDYGIGAQILADLGVRRIRLMSNNPRKFTGLTGYGVEIADRVPLEIPATERTLPYLATKAAKLGHWLDMTGSSPKDAGPRDQNTNGRNDRDITT